MKIEWMILGEGITQDAKGAFTMVGLNQNILVARELPTTTKRAVLAHLTFDDHPIEPNNELTFALRLTTPSGRVSHASEGGATLGGARWPDLPGSIDLPAEMVVRISEHGEHQMVLEVTTPEGKELRKELSLYVMPEGPAE